MVRLVENIDFDTVVPLAFDIAGTNFNKFTSWTSELKGVLLRSKPYDYCVMNSSDETVFYYPLVLNKARVLYLCFEKANRYLQCTVLELYKALDTSSLDLNLKKFIKPIIAKYYNYDSPDDYCISAYVGDREFWRPCKLGINEADSNFTALTIKEKIKGNLDITATTGLVLPCVFASGNEKILGVVEVDYFYMNIPILTLTCSRIITLDDLQVEHPEFCTDDERLYGYAMKSDAVDVLYYKDFKFGANDLFYMNTLFSHRGRFKSLFDSDDYKIEKFL